MGLAGLRHHRRFPLLRGAGLRSRRTLGGTGGEVLIAAMCALVTAVLQGLLGSLSVGSLALAATLGAAGGLLLVRGSASAVELVRYSRSGGMNKDWKALPGRVSDAGVWFRLVCTAPRAAFDPVSTLGYMDVLITGSNGESVRVLSDALDRFGDRVLAPCPFADEGEYEVRWYASTKGEKLYEVTRAKFPRLDRPGGPAA